MEKLKIQISEVEGISIKIPTEFTAQSYSKFYNHLLAISKTMPTKPFIKSTPSEKVSQYEVEKSRLNLTFWKGREIQMKILDIYEQKGKESLIDWMEETKGIKLTDNEKHKLSRFVAVIRAKYKMRSAREW